MLAAKRTPKVSRKRPEVKFKKRRLPIPKQTQYTLAAPMIQ